MDDGYEVVLLNAAVDRSIATGEVVLRDDLVRVSRLVAHENVRLRSVNQRSGSGPFSPGAARGGALDEPYKEGFALWHLDKATAGSSPNVSQESPALSLSGRAQIDAAEKRPGAGSLRLSGGRAVAEHVRFEGNPRSFEFFLKVHTLPEEGKGADSSA